jgi:5-oxoprolinase (ATP-hydrolysing) subunit C
MSPLLLTCEQPLRVVLGPQQDFATTDAMTRFLSLGFIMSHEADRMGCRLLGPKIELARDFNIVSDGIVAGSVQIPGSGQPIIMLVDRQTTGGYPKIATVITPDLRRLTQRRAGDEVRFTAVSIEDARRAAVLYATDLAALPSSMHRATYQTYRSDDLMKLNLAGAASNALDFA